MSSEANVTLTSKRRVLVVGGAGYVGSVLVRRLLAQGDEVTVLDNLIYDNGFTVFGLLNQEGFRFVRGDLCNPADLDAALAGVTDVVLLASLVGDPICRKYPEIARKVNDTGSKALFDRLAGRGINHFVFASTCSNYGLRTTDEPADETAELNPVSLYAETKVAVESHIQANATTVDFCPTILRVSTAYGFSPRMRFDLTISEFTRELAAGRDLLVYDENTWRPYCHVQDISQAVLRVLDAPSGKVRGEVFNVGSDDENFTKRMIVDVITKVLPEAKVAYKSGGHDPRNYRVNFDKIRSRLAFANQQSIGDEVPRLVRAVQDGVFVGFEERPTNFGNYEVKYL